MFLVDANNNRIKFLFLVATTQVHQVSIFIHSEGWRREINLW